MSHNLYNYGAEFGEYGELPSQENPASLDPYNDSGSSNNSNIEYGEAPELSVRARRGGG